MPKNNKNNITEIIKFYFLIILALFIIIESAVYFHARQLIISLSFRQFSLVWLVLLLASIWGAFVFCHILPLSKKKKIQKLPVVILPIANMILVPLLLYLTDPGRGFVSSGSINISIIAGILIAGIMLGVSWALRKTYDKWLKYSSRRNPRYIKKAIIILFILLLVPITIKVGNRLNLPFPRTHDYAVCNDRSYHTDFRYVKPITFGEENILLNETTPYKRYTCWHYQSWIKPTFLVDNPRGAVCGNIIKGYLVDGDYSSACYTIDGLKKLDRYAYYGQITIGHNPISKYNPFKLITCLIGSRGEWDSCTFQVASLTGNKFYCSINPDRIDCLHHLAGKYKDERFCDFHPKDESQERIQEECYLLVAILTGNEKLCDKVDGGLNTVCIDNVNRSLGDNVSAYEIREDIVWASLYA